MTSEVEWSTGARGAAQLTSEVEYGVGKMKEIRTAAIYGLGALGMLFGAQLQKEYGPENVKFVMDSERFLRHKNDKYLINGEEVAFALQDAAEVDAPSDLVIVAVKGPSLPDVVSLMEPSVGPDTIIMSLMNGITSEDILARKYGRGHILDCIAIGMDAMRDGTQLNYTQMGKIQFGSRTGTQGEEIQLVELYFDRAGVPFEVRSDIRRAMWFKYMLNVGVNQACTVYETDYGHVCAAGAICDEMKEAMREVMRLAAVEGIGLTEEDINLCIEIEKTLKPDGYPSMRQDALAGRQTEVDLFAGTVIELGKRYGIPTPVNKKYRRMLVDGRFG